MKKKKKIIKPKIDLVELSKNVMQFRLEITELHKAIRNSLVELAVNVDKNIKNIQELSKTVIPHTDSLKSLSAKIEDEDLEIFVTALRKNTSQLKKGV